MTSSSFKHDSFTPPATPAEKGNDRSHLFPRHVPSFPSYELSMKASSSPLKKQAPLLPSDHYPLSPPTTDPRQQRDIASSLEAGNNNNQYTQSEQGEYGGAFGSLRSVRFNLPISSPTFSATSTGMDTSYSPHSSPILSHQQQQLLRGGGGRTSDVSNVNVSDLLSKAFMNTFLSEESSDSPSSFSFSPALRAQEDDSSLSLMSKLDLNDYSGPIDYERKDQEKGSDVYYSSNDHLLSTEGKQTTPLLLNEPSRYLFVSLLPKVGVDLDKLADAFKKLGQLRGIYARDLYSHGVIILSFFDVRTAIKARDEILFHSSLNEDFGKRQLHPSFITREYFLKLANGTFISKVLSVGEGRLVIKAAPSLDLGALEAYVQFFGDVQSFRHDSVEKDLYLVEYFDDRCAARAFIEIGEAQIEGLEVGWDDLETLNQHIGEPAQPVIKEETKTFPPPPQQIFPNHQASSSSPAPESTSNRYILPHLRHGYNNTSNHQKSPPLYSPKASSPRSFPEGFTSATIASPNVSLPPFPAMNVVPNDMRRGGNGGHYGLIRDDPIPENNLIQFDRIYAGLEKRTSCIIRNLPNKMTQLELMENLDEIVPKEYDFIYLRFDFQSGSNCGFGFVNFISLEALIKFWSARLGTMWDKENSRKLVMGGYANIQGKKALMERFRNSSVMDQAEEYQPKIFHSSGPYKGLPEPFPPSNNAQRKAKSAYATGMFGLYGNKPKGGFRPVSMH